MQNRSLFMQNKYIQTVESDIHEIEVFTWDFPHTLSKSGLQIFFSPCISTHPLGPWSRSKWIKLRIRCQGFGLSKWHPLPIYRVLPLDLISYATGAIGLVIVDNKALGDWDFVGTHNGSILDVIVEQPDLASVIYIRIPSHTGPWATEPSMPTYHVCAAITTTYPVCMLGERDCLLFMHLTRCLMFRQVTEQYAAHASKVDKDAAWEYCHTLTHTWFSSTQDCLSCDENLTRGLKQIRKLIPYVSQFKSYLKIE